MLWLVSSVFSKETEDEEHEYNYVFLYVLPPSDCLHVVTFSHVLHLRLELELKFPHVWL